MPVTCHLCGRDFGRRSLGIHLAACRRRLEAEDRTEPEQPRLLASILRWTLELATNLREVFTVHFTETFSRRLADAVWA